MMIATMMMNKTRILKIAKAVVPKLKQALNVHPLLQVSELELSITTIY